MLDGKLLLLLESHYQVTTLIQVPAGNQELCIVTKWSLAKSGGDVAHDRRMRHVN